LGNYALSLSLLYHGYLLFLAVLQSTSCWLCVSSVTVL